MSFFGFAVVMIGNDVERKLIESENLKAKKIEKKNWRQKKFKQNKGDNTVTVRRITDKRVHERMRDTSDEQLTDRIWTNEKSERTHEPVHEPTNDRASKRSNRRVHRRWVTDLDFKPQFGL